MHNTQAEPISDILPEDPENLWYDEAFAPGQTPSFSAFLRAHIDSQRKIIDDDIKSLPDDEVTLIKLPDNMAVLYHADADKVGKAGYVYTFMAYLYDNHECSGPPKAGSFSFIMQVLSGKEKDIFKTIDRCKWNELACGMFEVLQRYPATTCRLFASGLVGYTVSCVDYDESPAYRLKLHDLVQNHILPAHKAKPYVMFHDAVAPGYNYPMDFMLEDYHRMSPADQGKAYLMMEERVMDDQAFQMWLSTKLKACVVKETDVALAILDEDRYSDDILFVFDQESDEMLPAIPEPRDQPLPLEAYQDGRFKQILASDPVPMVEDSQMLAQ